ncbi:flagellar basal body-associated FliL family protein [Thermosulfurimonas sp. F29]|uniref:flagellar basal body-associated FliL family protein n=1 Tax=Thermosulfurimonas sp. F29 TaxID=2867247 RepID=UPI001C83AF4B|nr:flagellar basal body-associated FliL family protein [Thermosulfurimonas sp. F29]MBX6423597.1 flagellar basal body-associated FliL family protein [Thermosulfurimonas sp. F29]
MAEEAKKEGEETAPQEEITPREEAVSGQETSSEAEIPGEVKTPGDEGARGEPLPEGAEIPEPEERPEELIRALESEEGEGVPSPEKPSRRGLFLLVAGILASLAGIGAGAYVLWNLVSGKSVTVSETPVSSYGKTAVSPASRGPLGTMPLEVRPEHVLVLKHFLIPLQSEGGAPVFIKASVVLYFRSQKEVLKARKLENPLRGVIYETFKNIPFYYWRSPEGVKRIKQALLKALRERAPEDLRVSDVEVTGYILE